MDTILAIVAALLLLFGIGMMIYFGILKTIRGNFTSKTFVGDDEDIFRDEEDK